MTLPLTPAIVRAAYDFLNETPPFDKWNLPDGDDITFRVATGADHYGWVWLDRKQRPLFVVSAATVGHTINLLATVAHEMVHIHQHLARMPVNHGPGFRKLAAQVCRRHGFDPKGF